MLFRKTRLKFYAKRDKSLRELYLYKLNTGEVEDLLAQIEDKELKENAPLYLALPVEIIFWIGFKIWKIITGDEFWKWLIIVIIIWLLTLLFGKNILQLLK